VIKILTLLACAMLMPSWTFHAQSQQLSQPKVTCLYVNANGDITISWKQIDDPFSVFSKYSVYDAGTNTLIGSVASLTNTQYVHIGASGQSQSKSYYVIAEDNGTGANNSIPSETASSVHMQLINPLDGTARLAWNKMFAGTNSPLVSNWYRIYREYPAGIWTLIDSTGYGNELYRDTISVCDVFHNYRVEVESSTGCLSRSSEIGDQFQDLIAPVVPTIYTASVDTSTNNVFLQWNVNPSLDTRGYIIFKLLPFVGWTNVDTIWGRNNTSHYDVMALPASQSELYAVSAFDSCWSGNPPAPNRSVMSIPHKTIYGTATLNVCERAIQLNWSSYKEWTQGIDEYQVYGGLQGSTLSLVGTVPAPDTTFTHNGLTRGETYEYVIKAVSNSGHQALSHKISQYVTGPLPPAINYLQNVNVNSDGEVEVKYLTDVSANVSSFTLERSSNPTGPFIYIAEELPGSNPVTFLDSDVSSEDRSYYYRVVVKDSCDELVLTSNNCKTILLTSIVEDPRLKVKLYWNEIEGWDGAVNQYSLFRSKDGGLPELVTTFGPGQNYFEDDVSNELTAAGEFCYYIEAAESVNSYGISEFSASNWTCAYIE